LIFGGRRGGGFFFLFGSPVYALKVKKSLRREKERKKVWGLARRK
jgi:hypothetical protein